MTAKVTFNFDRCKGCGLCVSVCPKQILKLIDESIPPTARGTTPPA
jgi:2-oxoglutarate ferredoxin oxidoreductase subunit delta